MADDGFDRLFEALEAQFEAALRRDEDDAAADLALSLRQDRSLDDVVARRGVTAVLPGGQRIPVAAAGKDFAIGAGQPSIVVPLHKAVWLLPPATGPDGPHPVLDRLPIDLLGLLRRLARRGDASVEIVADGAVFAGVVAASTADHVEIVTVAGCVGIPMEQIERIILRGGSEDAL